MKCKQNFGLFIPKEENIRLGRSLPRCKKATWWIIGENNYIKTGLLLGLRYI